MESRKVGKFTEFLRKNLLKRHPYEYPGHFLKEIEDNLKIIEDLDLIGINFLGKVKEAIHVKKIMLILYDHDLDEFEGRSSIGFENTQHKKITFYRNASLVRWLKVNKSYFNIDEQKGVFDYLTPKEQDILKSLEVKLCYPLISMNRLIGIIFIGPKEDSKEYSKKEMEMITSFTPQAAIALENALLYKEQRERHRKMLRADKLATIGELASGAAHEIRNPLTAIKSSLQYLAAVKSRLTQRAMNPVSADQSPLESFSSKERDEVESKMLNTALHETERIEKILSALLSFSRPPELKKENCDLIKVICETLELISFQANKQNVVVNRDYAKPELLLKCDKAQLKQLFLNLFLNSLQAMESGGELRVEIIILEEQKVVIRISDTGCGIPDENLDKIFDPFYTTKKGGTGLGLSICYGIVRSHSGDIHIKSISNHGTTVMIKLPIFRE